MITDALAKATTKRGVKRDVNETMAKERRVDGWKRYDVRGEWKNTKDRRTFKVSLFIRDIHCTRRDSQSHGLGSPKALN